MKVVYKYALPQISNLIELPEGSSWMKVGLQNDIPHIWVGWNESSIKYNWEIHFILTGEEFADSEVGTYLDTVFLSDGTVLHAFCRMK